MLRIIVVASGEGIQTTSEAVDRRVKVEVVIIWEYYVEVTIKLRGGKFPKAFRDESDADEVGRGTLPFNMSAYKAPHPAQSRRNAHFVRLDLRRPLKREGRSVPAQ